MGDNFEHTLDVCIDRIVLHGGTVEDCLIQHPLQAATLEPYLRIVARYAAVFQEAPSAAAKELGRQRLNTEMAAAQRAEANGAKDVAERVPPPTVPGRRTSFDDALDQSITRVLRGESVEASLSHYPYYATDLLPHLRMVSEAARVTTAAPVSASAKALGRLRLQVEMATLRELRQTSQRSPWQPLAFAWRQRWALAATAAFAIFIGGFGLVSASNDALPGQTLYPVKRAAEEVHLALAFSQEAKAQQYLAYAQKRGEEIGQLIRQGQDVKVSPTQDTLEQYVANAAAITAGLKKPQAVSSLQAQLEQNASQVMADLQTSLENSPEAGKQSAGEHFKSIGEAYSQRIEMVAAKAPKATASTGTLQLRAVDPLPPEVDAVQLQVGQIDVHRADWPNDRWLTISSSPQELDLLRLGNVQRFLGEMKVPAGVYTQMRFSINQATIVVGGLSSPVQVSGEMLHLNRPFRIDQGKTTVASLDFNGSASLITAGQNGYTLNPQVHLLTREPQQQERGQAQKAAPAISSNEPKASALSSTPRRTPTLEKSSPKQASKTEVIEVEGAIQEVLPNSLKIDNKVIALPPGTDASAYQGLLKLGSKLNVQVIIQPDGTFLAQNIESRATSENTPVAGSPSTVHPLPSTETFQGTLEALSSATVWRVSGHTVRITSATHIQGVASLGSRVAITGVVQPDGSLLAQEVTVTSAVTDASPTPTSGKGESAGSQGNPSTRKGQEQQDQAQQDQTSGYRGQAIDLQGVLRMDSPGVWSINGRRVVVDAATEVQGLLFVGKEVRVQGKEMADGTVQALRITGVLDRLPPGVIPSPTAFPSSAPASTRTPEQTNELAKEITPVLIPPYPQGSTVVPTPHIIIPPVATPTSVTHSSLIPIPTLTSVAYLKKAE